MADAATLRQRLDEAEQALHELTLGLSTASLRDASGSQVNYTPADAPALRAYIAGLKRDLGISGGRAPARLVFF